MKSGKMNIGLRCLIWLLLIFQIYAFNSFQWNRLVWKIEWSWQLSSNSKNEKLMKLCLTPSELKGLIWMKKHEFIYQKEWYDIEDQQSYKDGSVEMLVYHDKKDKKLVSVFQESPNSDKQDQNVCARSYKIQEVLTFIHELQPIFSIEDVCAASFIYQEKTSENHLAIANPPPDSIIFS